VPTGILFTAVCTNVLPETLQRGARPVGLRVASIYVVTQACSPGLAGPVLWLDIPLQWHCWQFGCRFCCVVESCVQFPLCLCKTLCGCFDRAAKGNVLEFTSAFVGVENQGQMDPKENWSQRQSHASFTLASSGTSHCVATPRLSE